MEPLLGKYGVKMGVRGKAHGLGRFLVHTEMFVGLPGMAGEI